MPKLILLIINWRKVSYSLLCFHDPSSKERDQKTQVSDVQPMTFSLMGREFSYTSYLFTTSEESVLIGLILIYNLDLMPVEVSTYVWIWTWTDLNSVLCHRLNIQWVHHSINAPGNHDNRTQPFSSEAMAASSARCDPVFNYSMLFLSYRFSAITEESFWKSGVLLIFVCKHRSVQFFIWHGNLQTEVHWATVWAVSL